VNGVNINTNGVIGFFGQVVFEIGAKKKGGIGIGARATRRARKRTAR
jgi:hypothetical protein